VARIVIHLSSRLDVSFSPRDARGLANAKPSQLDQIEISPSGWGIYFPKVDADLYLPNLLGGISRVKAMDGVAAGPSWRQVEERTQASRGQNKRAHGWKAKEDRKRLSSTGNL
jgi:hypothetical protein